MDTCGREDVPAFSEISSEAEIPVATSKRQTLRRAGENLNSMEADKDPSLRSGFQKSISVPIGERLVYSCFMANKRIAVVPGDGIGKEVIPAALKVVKATGA